MHCPCATVWEEQALELGIETTENGWSKFWCFNVMKLERISHASQQVYLNLIIYGVFDKMWSDGVRMSKQTRM